MNRRLRRVPLLWHVSYGTKERAGVGIVLDIHEDGCRIAGSLSVKVGMRLQLCLWPTQHPEHTFEPRGIVKWTNGLQFGLAFDTTQGSIPILLQGIISASKFDEAPSLPPVLHSNDSHQGNAERRLKMGYRRVARR